jgi:23S rRNA (cytosine1962-C5)-methyltransferase
MAFDWVTSAEAETWEDSATEIRRLGAGEGGWLEWWKGRLYLSALSETTGRRMLEDWREQPLCARFPADAVFFRELVHNPRPGQIPAIWEGEAGRAAFVVRENGLRYAVDLLDGYSPGLFPDQGANRKFLQKLLAEKGPGARMLNTFAYTGAFSVVAAAAGAQALSLDLSKRFLERARANFSLNEFDPGAHRWIADDVLDVLPRLHRRGEKFDYLILDPPTFSRGKNGKVFRVEKDYPRLLEMALPLTEPSGWILLSTNCRSITPATLASWVQTLRPTARLVPGSDAPDFQRGPRATTLWAQIG